MQPHLNFTTVLWVESSCPYFSLEGTERVNTVAYLGLAFTSQLFIWPTASHVTSPMSVTSAKWEIILILYLSMMCQRVKQGDLCSSLDSEINSSWSPHWRRDRFNFTIIIGVNLPRISVVLSDSKIYLLGIKTESVPGQIYRINQVIETLQVINKQMKVNMTHNQRNSCRYEQWENGLEHNEICSLWKYSSVEYKYMKSTYKVPLLWIFNCLFPLVFALPLLFIFMWNTMFTYMWKRD